MKRKYRFSQHLFDAISAGNSLFRNETQPQVKKQTVISIVDDDAAARESTKHLLQSLGHETHTFVSGESFLESKMLFDTHCLIVDIQMPGMSGIELQRRLTSSGIRLPVIFIAAAAGPARRARALAGGAIGFLDKPYSDESLIACLDKALSSNHQ